MLGGRRRRGAVADAAHERKTKAQKGIEQEQQNNRDDEKADAGEIVQDSLEHVRPQVVSDQDQRENAKEICNNGNGYDRREKEQATNFLLPAKRIGDRKSVV